MVVLLQLTRRCSTPRHAAPRHLAAATSSAKELYSTILPEETGQDTGFKPCGFIELATGTEDRLDEFRRVAAFNRVHGVDVREIEPEHVKELFPLCETEGILKGFYVPTDGRVNPVDATMAFSKGAKMHGATIIEGAAVEAIVSLCWGLRNVE